MRGLVPFLIIGFGIFIAFVVAAANRKKRERRRALLDQLAQRLSGQVVPGSWLKQPELHLSHRGRQVRLVFYSTGGKHPTLYTRLHCDLSSLSGAFRVKVYPEKFFSRLGKAFGTQDIQIGDQDFDSGFMIKGDDQERVKTFLSPETCQAIFSMRALVMNDHLDISAQGADLRIQKLSWLEAADLLITYIENGLRVFEAYLRAANATSTAEAFASPAGSTLQGTRCAVCADAIEGSNHLCPACGADHHPECFKLNDGCGRCGTGV